MGGLPRLTNVPLVCLSALRFLIGNKKGNVDQTEETAVRELAQLHNLTYLRMASAGDSQTERTLDQVLEGLAGLIPALPKPEQLIRKNVCVGKKLLQSSKYQMVK